MSEPILRRIASVIDQKFTGKIDMADWATRSEAEQRQAFLSRGLAALAIHRLANANPDDSGRSITDGGNDDGIDAIYYDHGSQHFYFVQSKWSNKGNRSIDLGSMSKFIDGIAKVLNADFSGFNDKIKNKQNEIWPVLLSAADIKIKIVVIHVGEQDVHFQVRQRLINFVEILNRPVPLAEDIILDQTKTYHLITSEHAAQDVSLQITLQNYGVLRSPYLSYYGRAHVLQIAQWWKKYGNKLCSRNIRQLIPRSDINDALLKTISKEPENFWYFNNGITIICRSAKRATVGITASELGIFHCDGVSVVNGAQTVGIIGLALGEQDTEALEISGKFDNAWVHVRIIPLEGCPSEFDRSITQATNFQNSVEGRDFAAMDATQHRLATEFMLDRRKYAYRAGEERPHESEGCTITEATQTLACGHSMTLTVQVKREIGLLWADTNKQPYTDIFNENTSSTLVWKVVQVTRAVDSVLGAIRSSEDRRASVIATHLNRAITNLVFSDKDLNKWRLEEISVDDLVAKAKSATHRLFPLVRAYLDQHHSADYLASFSKNSDKCVEMKNTIIDYGMQTELFK